MPDLDDQVAIVTGGGRGIGRAVAEALGARGAAVAVAARSPRELEAVAAGLSHAIPVPTDVTRAEQVERLVERTQAELGPPTLLVAGAGTWDHVGPAWEGDADAWWRDVEVVLRGAYLCVRAVLPGMLERGAGRIVVVSSYAARRADRCSRAGARGRARRRARDGACRCADGAVSSRSRRSRGPDLACRRDPSGRPLRAPVSPVATRATPSCARSPSPTSCRWRRASSACWRGSACRTDWSGRLRTRPR